MAVLALSRKKTNDSSQVEPRVWLKRLASLNDPSRLNEESQRILERAAVLAAEQFGLGSRQVLSAEFARWLVWTELNFDPAKGSYASFAWSSWHKLVRAHVDEYGEVQLAAEKADEEERDVACGNAAELCRYEAKWRLRLTKLVRSQASKWSVVDLPKDEIVDELMLKLVEAIIQGEWLNAHVEPGKEWTFQFLSKQKDMLRMRRQIYLVPRTKDVGTLTESVPTPEDLLSACEENRAIEIAHERAERHLSKPQKNWLSSLRIVLNGEGAGVFKSGQLNHAELARVLERSRSSAARAIREIQSVFEQERARALRDVGKLEVPTSNPKRDKS